MSEQPSRDERLKENLRQLSRNVVPPVGHRPLIEPGTYGPEVGLRPGTRLHRYFINFIFNSSGLGDYLNYSAALIWVHKNAPWIDAQLIVAGQFVGIFKHIFDTYGIKWDVHPGENAQDFIEPSTPIICPELVLNGVNTTPQYLNPIGAHLIDIGFAYYAARCPAPAGVELPRISFEQNKIPHKVRHLRGKYIVITTGVLTPSRFLFGEHLNPIIEHIKAAGFTPVFLGKDHSAEKTKTVFANDIDYTTGFDLRNQTDVQTAAAVMHYSAGVVGIDNGLLHLAACTDANVLFGYSIAGIDQRKPRRSWGKTWNFAVTKDELACANCQSTLKLMLGHTFHKCLYKDNKCIDILFIDKKQQWLDALDECFKMWSEKNDVSSSSNIPESTKARNMSSESEDSICPA